MLARYRLDPGHSRFTVQAFAAGLLSFLGHSPTFAVRDFAGEVQFDPGTESGASLQMTVKTDSLELVDDVRPSDRRDIEGRMRLEVLDTAAYPEVQFESDAVSVIKRSADQYQLRIRGHLALHGVTAPHEVDAQLTLYEDGIRLSGESPLRLSDHRISPVTAVGGTIKLKDQLRVAFDLVGWKDGRGPEGS
jgi:polyisoprenoid-binding protein YceI